MAAQSPSGTILTPAGRFHSCPCWHCQKLLPPFPQPPRPRCSPPCCVHTSGVGSHLGPGKDDLLWPAYRKPIKMHAMCSRVAPQPLLLGFLNYCICIDHLVQKQILYTSVKEVPTTLYAFQLPFSLLYMDLLTTIYRHQSNMSSYKNDL